MKTQVAFAGWFVLLGYFLPSASWADDQNVFPIKDPLVTGTFMEYRPGTTQPRFHGGVDLIPKISNQSNNIIRPVAKGELYYENRPNNTYRIWIKHPSGAGQYANLVTRYLHVGEYPAASSDHPEFHEQLTVFRSVTTDGTLGTIDTPYDNIGNHLHFEVLADYIPASSRDVPDGATYINPLSKLPSIQDASVNYAQTAKNEGRPWTWTLLDNVDFGGRYEDYEATDHTTLANIPQKKPLGCSSKGLTALIPKIPKKSVI